MKNFLKIIFSKTEKTGLFSIVGRCAAYGFLLFFLLYIQAVRFDSGELFTITLFVVITASFELILYKTNVVYRLVFNLIIWMMMASLLFVLIDRAAKVKNAWHRTTVLEARVKSLIDTAPAAIVVSDGFGMIKYTNNKVTRMLGWEPKDLLGKPLSTLIRSGNMEEYTESLTRQVEALPRGGAQWIHTSNRPIRLARKDGSDAYVKIYLVGLRYVDDDDTHAYGKDVEFYIVIQPAEGETNQ